MKKGVIIFLLLIATQSIGQRGFLGKRVTLNLGTAIAPPALNKIFGSTIIYDFYNWSLLPPELRAEVGLVVSARSLISVNYSYRGIQNSGFYNHDVIFDEITSISYISVDTFRFRSDNFSLGLTLQRFSEFAPVGRYFLAGMNYHRTVSTIYPTYYYKEKDNLEDTEQITILKKETGTAITGGFSFTLGFGRSRMLSRNCYIDYGFRTSFFTYPLTDGQNYKYLSEDEFDYKPNFNAVVDYVITRNLQSSYATELFFKFGFCK